MRRNPEEHGSDVSISSAAAQGVATFSTRAAYLRVLTRAFTLVQLARLISIYRPQSHVARHLTPGRCSHSSFDRPARPYFLRSF
jgi:hypothetical protein